MFKHAAKPCIASYCVICRDVQPFFLTRIGRPETGVAVIGACESCGLRSIVSPEEFLEISPTRPESVRELMEKTSPRLPLAIADRVFFEKRLAVGEIDPPERIQALREPFQVLSGMATRDRWLAGAIIASTFFGVVVMLGTLLAWDPQGKVHILRYGSMGPLIKGGLLAIPALAMFLTIGVYKTLKWRGRIRNKLIPLLARSLRPLRPTLDELDRTYVWLLTASNPVATATTPDQVHEAVCREPDRSLVNADDMDILGLAREMHERLTAQAEEHSRI